MSKTIYIAGLLCLTTFFLACKEPKKEPNTVVPNSNLKEVSRAESKENNNDFKLKENPSDYIPKGYVLFEKIEGDLNKDGIKDCVLIIKDTQKKHIITDEYRGKLDKNRRGVLVLLQEKGLYKLVVRNDNCFSSENEDGGVYFAPELYIEINNGKLYVAYGHGRYGYWKYTFRLKDTDFDLIGYDRSDNRGPIVNYETSINFLTKSIINRENINKDNENEEEVFEETTTKFIQDRLIKLSQIKDFDELELPE